MKAAVTLWFPYQTCNSVVEIEYGHYLHYYLFTTNLGGLKIKVECTFSLVVLCDVHFCDNLCRRNYSNQFEFVMCD